MAAILVIDEDADCLAFVRDALMDQGHEVVTFHAADATDRALAEQPFDVALLEVLMQAREGVETILALKQRWPARPVIAMSGGGKRVSAHTALTIAQAIGAQAVLMKPFSASDLLHTVAQVMAPVSGPEAARAGRSPPPSG